jgi:UDP-glucose 4,6-dehydratase
MAVLAAERVDAVLHFAAQTHVDNSFGNSLAFTLSNAYGTHVLLEACRLYGGVKRFVNVSTDEVYGETSLGLDSGLDERARLEPTNPYSAAKAGAELMARAYHVSYGLPVITTRGNNVYGPGQFPEKLIPKFLIRARRGLDLPVHGDGAAARSYLYVADVAEAFFTVLARGAVGEVYNVGTRRERSVLDVAHDVCALAGADASSKIVHVRDRAFNDRRYFICDKKLAALGWRESTPWAEGLAATAAWYEATPASHWDNGDAEAALAPHPALQEGKAAEKAGAGANGKAADAFVDIVAVSRKVSRRVSALYDTGADA